MQVLISVSSSNNSIGFPAKTLCLQVPFKHIVFDRLFLHWLLPDASHASPPGVQYKDSAIAMLHELLIHL